MTDNRHSLGDTLEWWREKALALCRKRGWSELAGHRFMIHILECAEFQEALRGKEGSPVEEAGDMFFTALVMVPEEIPMQEVVDKSLVKIEALMTAPPYEGEKHDDIDWRVIFKKHMNEVILQEGISFLEKHQYTAREWDALQKVMDEVCD